MQCSKNLGKKNKEKKENQHYNPAKYEWHQQIKCCINKSFEVSFEVWVFYKPSEICLYALT